MPLYEYSCPYCQERTSKLQTSYDPPDSVQCGACGQEGATRVLTTFAYHKSTSDKMAELDPKYDKMVDTAVSRAPVSSDPKYHLDKMVPFEAAPE